MRDGTIIGYVGWALCEPDIARALVDHGRILTFEQSREGDVVVPIVVIADERLALRQTAAYMRRRALRESNAVRTGRLGQGQQGLGLSGDAQIPAASEIDF